MLPMTLPMLYAVAASMPAGYQNVTTAAELYAAVTGGDVGVRLIWVPEGTTITLEVNAGGQLHELNSYGSSDVTIRSEGTGATIDAGSGTIGVSEGSARVLNLQSGARWTLHKITIQGGRAPYGGCVLMDYSAHDPETMQQTPPVLTLWESTLTDCEASIGGAVALNFGDLTLRSSTIRVCSVGQGVRGDFGQSSAGAISVNAGSVVLEDSTIFEVKATSTTGPASGGAFAIFGARSFVTLRNTSIVSSQVYTDRGSALGGVFFIQAGEMQLYNVSVTAAFLTGGSAAEGGVVYVDGGTVRIEQSMLRDATVSAHTNISCANAGSEHMHVSNDDVELCSHARGGFLFVSGGFVTLVSTELDTASVSAPFGKVSGGGIHVDSGTLSLTQLLIRGTHIQSGSVQGGAFGGGLQLFSGSVTAHELTIVHCSVSCDGCLAGGGGLNIYTDGASLTATDLKVMYAEARSNVAKGGACGGGLRFFGGTTTLENVTVAGTRAVSEEGLAAGGGMCVLDGPVTIIRASVSNTSVVASGINGKAYGGAVYSHMHSSFALIADPKDGWTAIKQSWIVNASATGLEGADVAGGGVYLRTPQVVGVMPLDFVQTTLEQSSIASSGTPPSHVVAGAEVFVESSGELMGTLLTIRHTCEAGEPQTSLIEGSGGAPHDVRGLVLETFGCDTAFIVVNATFSECGVIPKWRLEQIGAYDNTCATDATCRMAPLGESNISSAQCECVAPAYASPTAQYGLELAPYDSSCTVPLEMTPLHSIANGIHERTYKCQSHVVIATSKLSMGVSGTSWPVDPSFRAPWTATFLAFAHNMTWINVTQTSGAFEAPSVVGENAYSEITVMLDPTGLVSAQDPYYSHVQVSVHLPTGTQTMMIPVLMVVVAVPVPSRCTIARNATWLDDPVYADERRSTPYPAQLWKSTWVLSFVARDFEGFPVVNGFEQGAVQFAGVLFNENGTEVDGSTMIMKVLPAESPADHPQGVYNVRATLPHLGLFTLRVRLSIPDPGMCMNVNSSSESFNPVFLDFSRRLVAICPPNQYAGADVVGYGACMPCLTSMECKSATGEAAVSTISTLVLKPNFWRLSKQTTDIRVCSPHFSTHHPNSTTTCLGGETNGLATDYCAIGLKGPLCRVCTDDRSHFDSKTYSCKHCSLHGAAAVAAIFGILLGIALGIALLGWALLHSGSDVLSFVHRQRRRASKLGLLPKLKIAIGYYQVIVYFPTVFSVTLPQRYYDLMQYFAPLSFEWLGLFPLDCIGSFRTRLKIQALVPLVVLIALGLGCIIVAATRPITKAAVSQVAAGDDASGDAKVCDRASAVRAAASGGLRVLPTVLVALFALVPGVCARIFQSFACDAFGYDDAASGAAGQRWFLHADYSVQCVGGGYTAGEGDVDTEEYNQIKTLAYNLIVLWPVGVPLLFGALLFRIRRAIASDQQCRLAKAISFLHADYRRGCFWWELLELGRKLTLTGFLLLIPEDLAMLRLVIALLISVGYLVLLQAADPFKQLSTSFLALIANTTLVCSLVMALLLKSNEDMAGLSVPDASQDGRSIFQKLFGFSPDTLVSLILCFNVLVVTFASILFAYLVARDAAYAGTVQRLRYLASGEVVSLPQLDDDAYHIFLSHMCATLQPRRRSMFARPLPRRMPLTPVLLLSCTQVEHGPRQDARRQAAVARAAANGAGLP